MNKVLFVCLGNICRSPMAEGVFNHLIESGNVVDQWSVDSAGTAAYHIGSLPDPRMRKTASDKGIELVHRARQVGVEDFYQFDFIFAMDEANLLDLKELEPPDSKAILSKMRHYDPLLKNGDVPDPYYGGEQGFEEVYKILERSIGAFLQINSESRLK